MPTPLRSCRWCGSDRFIEAEKVEWDVRPVGVESGRRLSGSLVVCCRCGLVESFLDDPQSLKLFSGAVEVQVPAPSAESEPPTSGRGSSSRPGNESPAGSGWQVVLLDAGPQPIGVIAELRKELPISFANARAALKQLPWVLTRTSNRRMAEEISEKLSAMGASVRVEPSAV